MTVKEAQNKICPFMSCCFAADTKELRNGGLIEIRCKTSDCMAWEWKDEFSSRSINQREQSTTDGYCKRLEK